MNIGERPANHDVMVDPSGRERIEIRRLHPLLDQVRSANSIRRMAMVAFAVQLMLNLIWSFIFFGAQSPGFAAIEIVLLWISILITLLMFWRIDGFAGWLMSPYIVWVSFAIYLNISIVLLN